MTHHFAMTSSLLIKILKIDKFGVFSSDIDFKTKMDIFRDDISRLINQCHLQALPTRAEPTPMSFCGNPKFCDISLNMIHNCNLFAYANSNLFACE